MILVDFGSQTNQLRENARIREKCDEPKKCTFGKDVASHKQRSFKNYLKKTLPVVSSP